MDTHTLHWDFLANCSPEFSSVLLKWLWENTAAPLVYDVITGQLLHCWSLIKTELSSGGYGLSRPRQLTTARPDKQVRLFFFTSIYQTQMTSLSLSALVNSSMYICVCIYPCKATHRPWVTPGLSSSTLPWGHLTTDRIQPLGPGSNPQRPVYFHCRSTKRRLSISPLVSSETTNRSPSLARGSPGWQ